jgi:hypothetical protein
MATWFLDPADLASLESSLFKEPDGEEGRWLVLLLIRFLSESTPTGESRSAIEHSRRRSARRARTAFHLKLLRGRGEKVRLSHSGEPFRGNGLGQR